MSPATPSVVNDAGLAGENCASAVNTPFTLSRVRARVVIDSYSSAFLMPGNPGRSTNRNGMPTMAMPIAKSRKRGQRPRAPSRVSGRKATAPAKTVTGTAMGG